MGPPIPTPKPTPSYKSKRHASAKLKGKEAVVVNTSKTKDEPSTPKTIPSQVSAITRFPNELLHTVCGMLLEPTHEEVLQPAYSANARNSLKVRRSALRNFSFTCRAVYSATKALLYQDITFFSNQKRSAYLRLLRTLDTYQHWRDAIRSVDLAWFPSITAKMAQESCVRVDIHDMESKPDIQPPSKTPTTKLEPWFYKRMAQSFLCDRSKDQPWPKPTMPVVPEIFEDHALCMMLLSQLPDLQRARIRLPEIGASWRRNFDSRNLRWPSQNPRLARMKELQLCPQSESSTFPIFSSIGVLNGAPNLETLVLINGTEPLISPADLNLPHLRSLILKDCGGLILKPHQIKRLVRSFRQLRHFQIDFFDHRQTFNLGTKYADEPWDRYFTKFEVDWKTTALPPLANRTQTPRGAQQVTLNRYCNVATNLVDALTPVASTLESLYIGKIDKALELHRINAGRFRIDLKKGLNPLDSLKAFPKLKRLCIDVRMIHDIGNTDPPSAEVVLVDLFKDCQELEALMLYGVDHVPLKDAFAGFARAVDRKTTFPRLKKVAILADHHGNCDLGKTTRKFTGLAREWARWNTNKEVELVFLLDPGSGGDGGKEGK